MHPRCGTYIKQGAHDKGVFCRNIFAPSSADNVFARVYHRQATLHHPYTAYHKPLMCTHDSTDRDHGRNEDIIPTKHFIISTIHI